MKKLLSLSLAVLLLFSLSICAFAQEEDISSKTPNKAYFVDDADLIPDEDEGEIELLLNVFSTKNKFDLVVVTIEDAQGKSLMDYADDFYDYNGYGYGRKHDGALLLIRVQDGVYSRGNCWISTTGKGIDVFSDEDIQDVGKEITPYLLNSEYSNAITSFISCSEKQIKSYKSSNTLFVLGVAIGVGLIGAFIYTRSLKNKLNSVSQARDASNYIVDGSIAVSNQYDHFIYSNVVRTAKQSSSSGSSTHTSSSGTTHGGGGF